MESLAVLLATAYNIEFLACYLSQIKLKCMLYHFTPTMCLAAFSAASCMLFSVRIWGFTIVCFDSSKSFNNYLLKKLLDCDFWSRSCSMSAHYFNVVSAFWVMTCVLSIEVIPWASSVYFDSQDFKIWSCQKLYLFSPVYNHYMKSH